MRKLDFPHLYDKNTTCTLCRAHFTTKKLRSSFICIDYSDSDFYSHYRSETNNPLLYYVTVCPECGYSFSEEFSDQMSPSSRRRLTDHVSKRWTKRNFSVQRSMDMAVSSYKLALYCAELKLEKHASKAGLNHRLAWLYRSAGDHEQEHRFLDQSLNEYILSYMNEDYEGSKLTDMRILYLIGELSRRTGKEKQAIRYFSRIIEHQHRSPEKGIIEMAKDRWQEMRAEKALSAQ
ncbi:DUF2225 domain-containing protein [Metabacillus sp. 113a]|uniref:DUF2225 domain-containing protein n=1 Tax=Metabacillus sp. 113a TaxID=3404706 RepID=UPI003CF3392B